MKKTFCDFCQQELYKADRSSPAWKATHGVEVVPVNDEAKNPSIFAKISFHYGPLGTPIFDPHGPDFCEECKNKAISRFFHIYSTLSI